jgi:hypothetical protein
MLFQFDIEINTSLSVMAKPYYCSMIKGKGLAVGGLIKKMTGFPFCAWQYSLAFGNTPTNKNQEQVQKYTVQQASPTNRQQGQHFEKQASRYNFYPIFHCNYRRKMLK